LSGFIEKYNTVSSSLEISETSLFQFATYSLEVFPKPLTTIISSLVDSLDNSLAGSPEQLANIKTRTRTRTYTIS